jgi:hypothetical protein
MDTRYFHPRKSRKGNWKLEVIGETDDAHIHAYGVVPRDIKVSVERKENSGFRNTFAELERLAQLLIGGDR